MSPEAAANAAAPEPTLSPCGKYWLIDGELFDRVDNEPPPFDEACPVWCSQELWFLRDFFCI